MNGIEIQNLTKQYGQRTVVSHLNLTIPKGELFALLGVNGAGKSTTIKMLSGLVRPTEGDALLMGNSICQEPLQAKALLNVSPQETAVAPNLTVYENLMLIAGIYGFSAAEQKQRADHMINTFHLESIAQQRARTLSGGWQRRLSIAMALITDPQILFLDEPTLGLDVLARRELWQAIRQLKGKVTMILTTHYLDEAEALSDRIGIMAAGTLKALGTPAQLKEQAGCDRFEDAFVALCGEEALLA